jgi:hypothetical protein
MSSSPRKEVGWVGRFAYSIQPSCTDKKENYISLIYKEIQAGAVVNSYKRKGS